MYVRIVRARYDTAREADVTRIAQEQLVPAHQRLPGFKSYLGCVDRGAGRILSVTTWETQEQAQGVREALGAVVSQLQATGVDFDQPPEVYELVVQA